MVSEINGNEAAEHKQRREDKAATVIQKVVRGWMCRQRYKRKGSDVADDKFVEYSGLT